MPRTSHHPFLPLARGVLALGLLTSSMAVGPDLSSRATQAQEIDCNDEAYVKDWDCIQKRQAAERAGDPAAPAAEAAPSDVPPPPDAVAKAGDPTAIIFTLEDAGKEATQFIAEQGEDARGRWARSRFERGRTLSDSRLGPNVIYTKAWVVRDVEAARALFKEQAAIKDFPERTSGERVEGLNDPVKYDNVAEETAMIGGFWVDNTVWNHQRVVLRKGTNVAVLYLFGREDLFTDKDKNDTKLVDWFARKLAGRL